MDHYAVLGNPIEHSRSPYIHARFAAATGQAIDYGRLFCPLDGFDAVVRGFVAGGARGLNVTVPFKFEAARIAARLTPRAALAEAVNTLRFDAEADGGWLGDNTDGVGVVRDIQRNGGVALADARVLLVGAGGGAAGALGGLIEAGPAEVVVANRSADKALALVQRHAAAADRHHCALKAARLDDCGRGYDIVINATAASLKGAGVPVAAAVLGKGALAVDMMYGAPARPFLDWARAHGAQGRDGLGMLVEQAAEAFWLWRGVMPDTSGVLADLRRQVDAAAP